MSFSFGSPSSAPANSSLSSGFNFGANKPAQTGFGLTGSSPATGLFGSPATSAPAFGTATPTFSATGGFGLGSTGFGATSATPSLVTGITPSFGATSAAPSFGATTTPAFGATATSGFGSTATPGFGATATPGFGATGTPGFGATSTAPAFGATSTAPAFGATTTTGFGATSATSEFGATSANPGFGTPAFGLGGTPAFGTGATSGPSTGLSLAPATTASSGLGGFGFGAPNTGGLFGSTTTTATTLFAAPSFGLGGVAPSGSAPGGDKTEPPKLTKLPNEIMSTVDSFKQFVKKQKALSSEIMRVSIKPLYKVSRSCESTLAGVGAVRGEVSRARATSRRLRAAAAAALAAADRHDTGTELDGPPPPAYVKELISELEQQLIAFKIQMDVADKQMRSLPKLLTDQELTLGIRRMHEAGVALAGRLQAVHAQVRSARDQYLNLRKYVLKDHSNVFESTDANVSLEQIVREAEGSRKKSKSERAPHVAGAAVLDPRQALGSIQQLAGPSPFTYIAGTLSPFPNTDNAVSVSAWSSPQPPLNTSLLSVGGGGGVGSGGADTTFQLQKPPGKRGKQ